MNSYQISFREFNVDRSEFPLGRNNVVGTAVAKNGIEAIYSALRAKGVDESDLAQATHVGSNKRVILYGVTFVAQKVS